MAPRSSDFPDGSLPFAAVATGSAGMSHALLSCCSGGMVRSCGMLLDAGADVNRAIKIKGVELTPLQVAVGCGHRPVIDLLLQRGALLDAGEPRAIQLAMEMRRMDLLAALLKAGASPSAALNRSGLTPLMFIAQTASSAPEFAQAACRALVSYGADTSIAVDAGDGMRVSLLAYAIRTELGLARVLLRAGARPCRVALRAAIELEDVDLLRELLEADAPCSTTTWAHLADVRSDSCCLMARELMRAGVPFASACDCCGVTPLHHAATSSNLPLARLLLRHGAVVAARCHEGKTPMDVAAGPDAQAILRWLRGARRCFTCGRQPRHLGRPMKVCSGCDWACYCDGVCQRSDWEAHKGACRKAGA